MPALSFLLLLVLAETAVASRWQQSSPAVATPAPHASAGEKTGMEGVLTAYGSILKTDPQATEKSLDDLLQKQAAGKLADAVREKVKDCH